MEGPNISLGARSTAKVPFFVCVSKKKKKTPEKKKTPKRKTAGKKTPRGAEINYASRTYLVEEIFITNI